MNSGFNILRKRKFNSFIDNVMTEIKIISFLIISFAVFFAPGIYGLLSVLGFIFLFSLFAKTPIKYYWKSFKPLFILFPILLLLNYFIFLDIYQASLLTTEIILRIYILIFISSILILTSTEIEIANGIETLMSPLKYVKVPIEQIALIISLGIRYIPILIFDAQTILEAQATRGNDFKTGGIKAKTIAFLNLFNPLILSSFYKAEETSNAMYVRGYRLNQERTKYRKPQKLTFQDYLVLSYFIIIFAFVIALRFF